MGTRADFYVGRGASAEWLGSIAWDGYPDGITPHGEEQVPQWPGGPLTNVNKEWPGGAHLFDAATEAEYRERVLRFFKWRNDVTLPEHGWPWPWDTSHTTDYAYAFDGGKVWASCFGNPWFDPKVPQADGDDEDDDAQGERPVFPDMSERKNVTFGARSGVVILGVRQ